MRSYVPNTVEERREMLKTLGLSEMDELFADIPADLKLNRELDLPAPMSEMELRQLITGYVLQNDEACLLFRGAGAYHHYIPALIPQLISRSEFYTAYTPYQAEMSQGMLQGIFEWQTVICNLTGMDAANASVYDGATAAAESLLMLRDSKRKNKILYSAGLHPDVIGTVKTYGHCHGLELVEIGLNENGITDIDCLKANLEGSAGFIAAQPNYFGCIENMDEISTLVHGAKALLVSYVNPISSALSNALRTTVRILLSAMHSPSAFPCASAARMRALWQQAANSSAICPAESSVKPLMPTATAYSFSPFRHASSTFAAKRLPATSAPTRCSAQSWQPCMPARWVPAA